MPPYSQSEAQNESRWWAAAAFIATAVIVIFVYSGLEAWAPHTLVGALIALAVAATWVTVAVLLFRQMGDKPYFWRLLARMIGAAPPRRLRARWGGLRGYVAAIIGIGVAAAIVDYVLIRYGTTPMFTPVTRTDDTRSAGMDPHHPVQLWVKQLALAGLPEELFYRAPILTMVVMTQRAKYRTVRYGLVAVTAVGMGWLFVEQHAYNGAANMAVAAVLAIVATGLALWTRTIWAGVIAHTTYNTLIYLPI